MISEYKIKNLEELLRLHIKTPVLDQTITRLTAPGENYGSLILKVDVKFNTNGGDETFHVVAKCVPRNKAMQEIFNSKLTFKNEIGWYTEVIPTFQEFQRENNVQIILNCFPKFYGSRLSLNPESNLADTDGVILLENLAVKGYKTGNRFEGFKLDTSQQILRQLAALHAVFLSLKLRKPDIFYQKVKPYITHTKKDPVNFSSSIISYLENSKGKYKHLMPRIKKAVEHEFIDSKYIENIWTGAVHNDFWVNNILIGDSDKIAIVDFQICAYGSIVLDLMFFLATSVNIDVAKQHLDGLIAFYYNEFVNNLKLYKMDLEVFNFQDFLNEIRSHGKGSFARAIFTVLIVLGEEGKNYNPDVEHFDPDGFIEVLKENLTPKQKEKCCFLVEEFAKREWI